MGMKEKDMLCITMRRGEYFTVNGDTVIMLDQFSGDRIRMAIHAPKEVTVLRGAVLERNGAPPPACVAELSTRKKAKYRPDAIFRWNDQRERAVRRMEQLAKRLEENGAIEEANILRGQLEQIVPTVWEDDLTTQQLSVSPG